MWGGGGTSTFRDGGGGSDLFRRSTGGGRNK